MIVNVMLDKTRYNSKPSGEETAIIQNRLIKTHIKLEELSHELCNGCSFRPAILGNLKDNSFIEQQLFGLDFDENTTIENEIAYAKAINLEPVFVYTTFSHTEQNHKFRMVFCADTLIHDKNTRDNVQNILMHIFNNCDTVAKNSGRLFYGGRSKTPYYENYNSVFNVNELLSKHFNILNLENSRKEDACMKTIPKYNKKFNNVKYISNLDLDRMKFEINGASERKGVSNNNNLLYLLSLKPLKTIYTEKDLFDFINHIDLHEFLGIYEDKFRCILPNHHDDNPSANIYKMDNGIQIYKCFGCNRTLTIIGLVELLSGCRRHKAIEFIKAVYNIELVQSDWVRMQKQLMIDSANYLDSDEFNIQFPCIAKLIKTRKVHIQKMLLHFTQYVSDDLKVNDKPLFYSGYKTLCNVCGINPNKMVTLSQSLILFALLNMLNKVEIDNIPEAELNKAKSISATYGFNKLTNFYQFEEYDLTSLCNSEMIAKKLIDNNVTIKGLSREYILRTFPERADEIFPQYKYENKRGTTEKSDTNTLKISSYILNEIETNGYILEKEVNTQNKIGIQWKKSIQEILDTYDLVRVRCTKNIKEKYSIKSDGYPFIIIKNEE